MEAAVGAERDRLWSAVTARYPVYRRYAEATKREIPVVVLRANVGAEATVREPKADKKRKTDDAPAEVEMVRKIRELQRLGAAPWIQPST